jgi:hypothetical protein
MKQQDRKKAHEKRMLKRFFDVAPFAAEILEDNHEPPDFVVRIDGRIVGGVRKTDLRGFKSISLSAHRSPALSPPAATFPSAAILDVGGEQS